MDTAVEDVERVAGEASGALESYGEEAKLLEGAIEELRGEYERDANEASEAGDLESVKQEVEQASAALESLQSRLREALESTGAYIGKCEDILSDIEDEMETLDEEIEE